MGLSINRIPTITQPGDLDRRATLRSRVDVQDNLGQPVPTWTDEATVFALWVPELGGEAQDASQLEPLQGGTLRIRYRSDITSAWRVLLGSVVFEIVAPPVEIGRRAFVDLKLRSLNPSLALP